MQRELAFPSLNGMFTFFSKIKGNLSLTIPPREIWLVNHFVRVHFTTKVVPAVKLGILAVGIAWTQLLTIRYAV